MVVFIIKTVQYIVHCFIILAGKIQLWQAVLVDVGTLMMVIANGVRPLYCGSYFIDKTVAHIGSDLNV